MRDKKDNATLDLPGFDEAMLPSTDDSAGISQRAPRRTTRNGAARPQQHQFELLEETDASGLPVWRRDEGLDVTGLPVWAAA